MDTEYEKQIKGARDRIAACQSACMTIAVAVGIIERELIHDRVPGDIESAHADIVEAGSHARVTCAEIDSLSEHAAAAAKGLAKATKDLEFIARAGRRLFADIMARADAEEQRRREEEEEERKAKEKRQQELPIGGAPKSGPGAKTIVRDESQEGAAIRAPKDIPGIERDVIRDLGWPATLRDLGRKHLDDTYLPGDKADAVLANLLAELKDGDDFALTDAETAELRAGIGEGIAAEEAAQLQAHLAKARELARADAKRKDGGRFRTALELWTSAAFDPLPELEPQREVFFAAYEETYAALRPPKPAAKNKRK